MASLASFMSEVEKRTHTLVHRTVSQHLTGQEGRIDQLVNALLSAGLIIPEESAYEFRPEGAVPTYPTIAEAVEASAAGTPVEIRRVASEWVVLA